MHTLKVSLLLFVVLICSSCKSRPLASPSERSSNQVAPQVRYFFQTTDSESEKETEVVDPEPTEYEQLMMRVAQRLLYEPCPCCQELAEIRRNQEEHPERTQAPQESEPITHDEILSRIREIERRLTILEHQYVEALTIMNADLPQASRQEFAQSIRRINEQKKNLQEELAKLRARIEDNA